MDLTSLLAAAVGAAIGLSGDLAGRLSSQRQAVEARRQALEDEARTREQAIEDQRQAAARSRGRKAAENMMRSFMANPINVAGRTDAETANTNAIDIIRAMMVEIPHIADVRVRDELYDVVDCIDLAYSCGGKYGDYTITEVIFEGRKHCWRILGPWLRCEEIPSTPFKEWQEIRGAMPEVISAYESQLQASGIRGRAWQEVESP